MVNEWGNEWMVWVKIEMKSKVLGMLMWGFGV